MKRSQNYNRSIRLLSLTIAAISNAGVILRSSEGGASWKRQNVAKSGIVEDIHFSDSRTGIIAFADTINSINVPTDGGEHWQVAPIRDSYLSQCHSYGNGKYRLVKYGTGQVYTT